MMAGLLARLSRVVVIAIAALAGLSATAASAAFDEARAKAAIGAFLGYRVEQISWRALRAREGVPNWYHPVIATLNDPPDSATETEHRLFVDLEPRAYYVRSALWGRGIPFNKVYVGEAMPLQTTRAVAEAFASKHYPRWSDRMRPKLAKAGPREGDQQWPCHEFWWEEFDGDVRTGSYVRVGINPRAPGSVYSYVAYIAPKFAADSVKITREEAVRLGMQAARDGGDVDPRLLTAELYLAEPQLEQPHWKVVTEDPGDPGDFLGEVLIDAITGKVLRAVR